MAEATTISCRVKFAGQEIKGEHVFDAHVEADLDQPDMAAVILSNGDIKYSEQVVEGDDFEIELGIADGKTGVVFKGEVTGIEPIYAVKAPSRVIIRGLNQLHRLTRGKRSVAYKNVTDKDLCDRICQECGLSAKYGDAPPSTKYEHVYQNNLTHFEFLKSRAKRVGFDLWVVDKELHFQKRVETVSDIKLNLGAPGESGLERFLPRLSTAQQVAEVRVFGWNPDKKESIVGTAKPQSSKLGKTNGAEVASQKHGNSVYAVSVETPVSSIEEAENIAKSILDERLMHFITGDGVARGNPNLRPGIVIEVSVQDKRFDGNYFVTAVRHRYVHEGPNGGYRSEFKVRRDARS